MSEAAGEGGGVGNPSPRRADGKPGTPKGATDVSGAAQFGVAAVGTDAARWIKSLASPRAAEEAEVHAGRALQGGAGESKPSVRGAGADDSTQEGARPPPPALPPAGAAPHSGRWKWEPYGSTQAGASAVAVDIERGGGERKDEEGGGFLGFLTGRRGESASSEAHRLSSAEAKSARSSRGLGMPCITLREDTRGNVSLFGMEPGGALQRLGTVRSGDVIVEVDGRSALGCTERQVRAMLVGEKGSVCTIRWISPDKVSLHARAGMQCRLGHTGPVSLPRVCTTRTLRTERSPCGMRKADGEGDGGRRGEQASGVDVAQLLKARDAADSLVVVTQLVRDIAVSPGVPGPASPRRASTPAPAWPDAPGGLRALMLTAWMGGMWAGAGLVDADMAHTEHKSTSRSSVSTARVSWRVSRTSARSSAGYGSLPQHDPSDCPRPSSSSWWPLGGDSTAAPGDFARVGSQASLGSSRSSPQVRRCRRRFSLSRARALSLCVRARLPVALACASRPPRLPPPAPRLLLLPFCCRLHVD